MCHTGLQFCSIIKLGKNHFKNSIVIKLSSVVEENVPMRGWVSVK